MFSYDPKSDDERSFTLGPLDLTLATGELVFIIGATAAASRRL